MVFSNVVIAVRLAVVTREDSNERVFYMVIHRQVFFGGTPDYDGHDANLYGMACLAQVGGAGELETEPIVPKTSNRFTVTI